MRTVLAIIGLLAVIGMISRSCEHKVDQHTVDVLGTEVCTRIAEGMTLAEAHEVWVAAGAPDDQADGLTWAAVHDYCPQYTDRLGG